MLHLLLARGRPAHVPHKGLLLVVFDELHEAELVVVHLPRGEEVVIEDEDLKVEGIVRLGEMSDKGGLVRGGVAYLAHGLD